MATKKKIQESSLLQNRWLLPTNHYNLMSWLSAGMILPNHSMAKYYPDCLELSPGWIPIFFNRVPHKIRDLATSKAGQLVVLEIDISKFSGLVFALTREGILQEQQLPLVVSNDFPVFFIPAPLPTTCINSAFFENKAARDIYIERSEEISSIPSNLFHVGIAVCPVVADDLTIQTFWPPQKLPEHYPTPPTTYIFAQGAAASLLFALGNLSDATVGICREAFDAFKDDLFAPTNPFRSAVDQLMSVGTKPSIAELRSRLYWGVVERIIAPPDIDGYSSDANYAVLHYLEQESKAETALAGKFQELISDLRGTAGLANYTHRELFEKHPGPFSHALLLFFLREHSDELLDFNPQDFSLTVADKIAAAILFAARDSWEGIPPSIRGASGLYAAISHRMSGATQKLLASKIDLGTPSERCKPLRELLNPKEKKRSKQHIEAALYLARKYGWGDAIETRIRLGKGEYRLEIGSSGCEIILPGEVKSVETTIVDEIFFDYLSRQISIEQKVDAEVRRIFGAMPS
jgi:hypothetical protein